ncbi:hypothetical protein L1857_33035 [Amycolatopsis thermalba]|uniref:Uncharacterized protein n=1 Tax=Amycolatopsis thermalba TaxID=944492 RepID=A0ABY4P4R7_9PSEU|nr:MULTISPECIES: hypothetical protein [Amycolatopsis]UQS27284.1 hypothetical protein L1857_33035 [Amycolatopsis thermalba]
MTGINIGGGNFGPINTGTNSGSMSGANINQQQAPLVALLEQLRAQTAALEVEDRKALDRNLAGLLADAHKAQDPENADDVEPEVVRTRWEKVKNLLSQASEVSGTVAQIGGHISGLIGAF